MHSSTDPSASWSNRAAWCVVHTALGKGEHFLRTLAAWRADPMRPHMLHYVAFSSSQPDAGLLQSMCAEFAEDLRAGQHRLCFESGRVLLTLCIGPTLALLRQQQFEADAVVFAQVAGDEPWTEWAVKALARCCRRGTKIELQGVYSEALPWLVQFGFELDGLRGVFNPRWELKTTREVWRSAIAPPQRCVVVGAGLSGASVAAALARRGWQVEVLDQANTPAQGASGLPVGLLAPMESADDNVLSQLVRSGVRLTLQQAKQLLIIGQDWARSGVQTYFPTQWHAMAGWIKPAALVRAWLATAGVQFRGNANVQSLRRSDSGWELLDAKGAVIAAAPRVVLANAMGAMPLVQGLNLEKAPHLPHFPQVHGVRGLVSWAQHDAPEQRPFPTGPVNGSGSLIPFVPFDGGPRWFVGASYQPVVSNKPEWPDDKNHGANVLRLEKLLPALSDALAPVFESGALQAWKGVRCVTSDRLPMVGSVLDGDPSLWLCVGMGSRGLSHVVLCSELLAAQWAGEPLPVEAALAQCLAPQRKRV